MYLSTKKDNDQYPTMPSLQLPLSNTPRNLEFVKWKMFGNISDCVKKIFLYFTASLILAWISVVYIRGFQPKFVFIIFFYIFNKFLNGLFYNLFYSFNKFLKDFFYN